MSFTRNNENFLKFGFDIPLRGHTGADRVLKYQKEVRTEARRRFREYYEAIRNDLSEKLLFYQELLSRFGTLEQQFLLYSIYFDTQSDNLISYLKTDVSEHLDLINEPLRRLFEHQIAPHDNSYTKGYLKQYFTETLDLSSGQWEEEDDTRNPITNELTKWLVDTISHEPPNEQKLEEVILNYTKLWNIYFTHPYNSTKALILIYKLTEQYKKIDAQKINVDLTSCFSNINRFLSELLPAPFYSPISDLENRSALRAAELNNLQSNSLVHLNKNIEFQNRLKQDSVFFQDLSKFIWPKLMIEACTTQLPARKAYLSEIEKRRNLGKPPNFSEINQFTTEIGHNNVQQSLDHKVLENIISDNYLFFV
ncbi:hypothetical protein [Mucilaginibacter sp.]|jgi:hypothetical protein|uniref:hypothetical protein n=1 Tax=Mucilaginibacter sp. TaxID=1882438 RepID=UPI002C6E164A|nr:hypothetical protein [Mucilaginibacter sp.]HTI58980.1 hypothetical protein [Mucilaginibacter sp.]